MSFAVLSVPLLPLLAALLVAGSASSRRERARFAAIPMGAAFCGAIVVLYLVATQGPDHDQVLRPGGGHVVGVADRVLRRPAERGHDGR